MFPDDALLGCILPAHAGMIPTTSVTFGESENITRTCGDDPGKYDSAREYHKYYPHMRG